MPGAEVKADLWVSEYVTPYDVYQHGITRVLADARTEFQEMRIVETGVYGRALVLDGKWQSCTGDEFLYHEPLVHPACVAHGQPRDALVLGGGEGATVRELLRWGSIERVAMVDIDGEVVEACREHLPEMHRGAFDDPRTELVIGDALKYLDDHTGAWDVIVSDLSDPIEDGPSFALFTREYFEQCKRALREGGVLVVQAGPLSPPEMHRHVRLRNTLGAVFSSTASVMSAVPTYPAPWSFVLASDTPLDEFPDPDRIDALLEERGVSGTRMFDGRALLGMLQVPKHVREALDAETEVYTMERPPTFFGVGVAGV